MKPHEAQVQGKCVIEAAVLWALQVKLGPRDPLPERPIPAGAFPIISSQQGRVRALSHRLFSGLPACAERGSEAATVRGQGSGLEGGASDFRLLLRAERAEYSGVRTSSEIGSQAVPSLSVPMASTKEHRSHS